MALPFPIAATQTDKKSPVDDQLMDAIRENLDYLDSQIAVSGSQAFPLRVNGELAGLPDDVEFRRRLDGAIIGASGTFTINRLYLGDPGDSGTLEIDARKYQSVLVAIQEILDQYSATISSITRAGSAFATQSITRTTTQVNTQSITRFKGAINIDSIITIGNNEVRYNLASAVDGDYAVGDSILVSGATAGANNGTFVIVRLNDDGEDNIVITNASGVDQTSAAGTVDLEAFSYNLINPANSEFTAGEKALFASHTSGANDGTLEIYSINDGGNNIIVKNPGGATQGGVAGTIDVQRFSYNLSSAASSDFAVGETAHMTSHSSGVNNGDFTITALNNGGNNVQVYNENGTTQGGVAGNVDSNRWIYALPSDPSSDFAVNDEMVVSGASNSANDGTFVVKEVNRSATNNLVVFNEAGVTQGGSGGTLRHINKLYRFATDQSSIFTASTPASRIEVENCVDEVNNGQFDVLEVNRGGGSNFNVVVRSEFGTNQASPSGRITVESKSIFSVTPKITVTEKIQLAANGTFNAEAAVVATDMIGLEVLQIPSGNPRDVVLQLR